MPVARSALGAPVSGGYPVITIAVIGLCVAMYIGQQASGDQWSLDLMFLPRLAWYEPWRIVTAAFMHASIIHLLLNMYALWVVGSFMEQQLGRARFLSVYLGSALGGHVMILIYFRLFDYTQAGAYTGTVGASGAIFGLFAATLLSARKLRANVSGIAMVIGLNLIISFTVPNISWQGHLGGLVTGGLMALAIVYAPPARRRLWAVLAPTAVVVLTVLVMYLTAPPSGPRASAGSLHPGSVRALEAPAGPVSGTPRLGPDWPPGR
ncbi:MAG: rhomboid family intramembrane serine protease [Bifidobacteriaceae bacterium]|jgi:membrane associated rhomboid family serine protease|nr:rhomboid family intramembrane serine protease [Bifidobacteriaceae bacterium]